ncbi:MAG: ABC transporter ATP-binding protein [Acetobacteraceae bacterium]|nr:ABC transporter ATP-binding protein [Acetobacteraceae bacterium]
MSEAPLLDIERLERRFGGLAAVDDLSFHVAEGEIVSIIGPNGAGKTTAFNLITCIFPPTAGAIRFKGENLAGLPLHRVAARGIGRTFQNLRIFPNLSVRENVLVGLGRHDGSGMLGALLRHRRWRAGQQRMAERADELIGLVELGHVAELLARNLAYGDRRRLEIARALATEPTLLLLDEPAAGMNPAEVEELNGLIRHLRDALGKTILLVEHHMSLVMAISDRVIVMDQGRKIAEGTPDQVRADPAVIRAYLGSGLA